MNKTSSKPFHSASVFIATMSLLQIFGLVRYLDGLPEDWFGIGLYIVMIIAFVIASFGFYVMGRDEEPN